jgi:hypothetical protein
MIEKENECEVIVLKYVFSINNGIDWVMLPYPAPVHIELGLACRGHFVGDPTADCETEIAPDNRDEIAEDEEWVRFQIFQKAVMVNFHM